MKMIRLPILLTAILLTLLIAGTGCDSGGGGDDSTGTTTIEGSIQSFTTDGLAQYISTPKASFPVRCFQSLKSMLVPDAAAATGTPGVNVSVANTDLSTQTDENGFFIISGVPQGNQQLLCEYQGQYAQLDCYCPSNSTIRLNNVVCQGGGRQQLNLSQDFQQNGGVCTVDGVTIYRQGGSGGRYRGGR